MRARSPSLVRFASLFTFASLLSNATLARADEAPPLPDLPPNVEVAPDGGVVVERTPAGGVDVHAQTGTGTVRAYGCDRVELDPSSRGAPCPYAAPYPPPRYAYPPHAHARPYAPPRYARDPGRTAALIASSLVFGIGTLSAGGAYLASADLGRDCSTGDATGLATRCSRGPSAPALYAMGAFMTVTPSVPRYVVGDLGPGLLFTGLRGGSFALGAGVDWDDDSHVLPVMLAFVVPTALGVVDLATTPHREDLAARAPEATATARLTLDGLGPTATLDASGRLAPALGAMGRF
jgi:hypothetical protein